MIKITTKLNSIEKETAQQVAVLRQINFKGLLESQRLTEDELFWVSLIMNKDDKDIVLWEANKVIDIYRAHEERK